MESVEWPGGASEFALHRSGFANAQHFEALARSGRRADLRISFLAAGARGLLRWCTKLSIGSTEFLSAHRWPPKPQQLQLEKWASRGAIRWRCFRSADTTWRNIFSTGSTMGKRDSASAENFPCELVSQRRRRKIFVAGIRRKCSRAEMDSGAYRRPRRGAGNSDWYLCPPQMR